MDQFVYIFFVEYFLCYFFRMDPQISWTKKANFLDGNEIVVHPKLLKLFVLQKDGFYVQLI